MKTGVILNNIGTPKSAGRADVGAYLDEFLMDPDVIALPYLFRALLVKGLIVPFRSRSSSAKYQKIWMTEGSPLLVYTELLQQKLQKELGIEYSVKIGMRYGSHSLANAIRELKQEGVGQIIFASLYPQFAAATTGSAVRRFQSLLTQSGIEHQFQVKNLEPFYDQDFFLRPLTQLIQPALTKNNFDHVLFSYHGLPISQNRGRFAKPYDQQCLETSKFLADRLALSPNKYSTSFQSRLGPSKWLGPATVTEIERLVRDGKKKIAIVCPSFVTDCLETLEEIGHELREHFHSVGGEHLELVPCLNDNDLWAKELASHLRQI